MKKLILLPLFTLSIFAHEIKPDFDGYAYMMLGSESVNYHEKASVVPVNSSVTAMNYVQMSGGLTRVNETFDFSIDSTATVLSNEATEQWKLRKDFLTIDKGTLLQENSFDIIGSKLKILLHYKLNNEVRIVAGPAYTLDTFKRYTWIPKHPAITKDTSVQEERYASLQGHIGVAYESYMPAYQGLRTALRLTYGHPLWQETKNTKEVYSDVRFNENEGYNVDADLYFGYTVSDGLELGLYGGYAIQHREGGKKTLDIDGNLLAVEWPENDLSYLRTGLMFVWKFRE